MKEPRKRVHRPNKADRRQKLADLDFRTQLEDFWHLLEKKTRLGRKELFKRTPKD